MKENETRGFSPAAYTTPASVFNTVAVNFQKKDDLPEPVLITKPIPMQNLQKLDPEVPEPNVTGMKKSGTLERSSSRTSTGSATPRMGSLERKSSSSSRMNSLERNAHISSHSSLDKSGMFSPQLGSLERKSRNSSPKTGTSDHSSAFSPKMGSLDRNAHIGMQPAFYEIDNIPNYHPHPVVYQFNDTSKDSQHFEESIYDFGGADVKSCARQRQFFVQQSQHQVVHQVGHWHGFRVLVFVVFLISVACFAESVFVFVECLSAWILKCSHFLTRGNFQLMVYIDFKLKLKILSSDDIFRDQQMHVNSRFELYPKNIFGRRGRGQICL